MKNIFNLLAVLALVLASAVGAQAQQFTLTQTTVSADITASQTTFQLASVTGIVGQGSGPGTGTAIYIDRELASVISVNTSGKTVNVLRGINGTLATAHKASNMALFGNPNAFVNFDQAGTCVVAQVPAQPSINVFTGNQWLCSTITLTWVPGFGNSIRDKAVTTAVASATTIVPTGPLFHVTGTTSIVNVTTPTGCNATVRGGCQFTAIADGVMTWTAAGNISAAAGTVVAGTSITFTWDATNSKWVPSSAT